MWSFLLLISYSIKDVVETPTRLTYCRTKLAQKWFIIKQKSSCMKFQRKILTSLQEEGASQLRLAIWEAMVHFSCKVEPCKISVFDLYIYENICFPYTGLWRADRGT